MNVKSKIITVLSILLLAATGCQKDDPSHIKGSSEESEITLQQYGFATDTLTFLVRTVVSDSLMTIDGQSCKIAVKDDNTITVNAKLAAGNTFAYPSSMVKSVGGKKVAFNVPEYQQYIVDKNGRQILNVPMAGYVPSDGKPTLYHLAGIKRVTVHNNQKVDIYVQSVSIGLSSEAGTHFWSKTDEIDLTATQTISSDMMHSGDPRSTLLLDNVRIAAGDSAYFHLMTPRDVSSFQAYLTVKCTQDDVEGSALEYNDEVSHSLANYYSDEHAVIDTHNSNTLKLNGNSLSGNGTKLSPYLIYTKDDLLEVYNRHVNDKQSLYIQQMAGIDASGDDNFNIRLFGANREFHYDGRGHTLKMDGVLIYSIIEGSEISNLTFKSNGYPLTYRCSNSSLYNVNTIGDRWNRHGLSTLSGLVDTLDNSSIARCTSYMNVTNDSSYDEMNAGGVVGVVTGSSSINSCYFRGSMNIQDGKNSYVGGIAGRIKNAPKVNFWACYNYGSVTVTMPEDYGNNLKLGGIVGSYEADYATFQNIYNYGTVTSNGANITYQGGIAGYFAPVNADELWYLCNNGSVTSNNNRNDCTLGGVIGYAENTQNCLLIKRCYNSGLVHGMNKEETYIGGLVGQINMQNTYYKIRDCYNAGALTAENCGDSANNYWYVCGGILGWMNEDHGTGIDMSYIANCLHKGAVVAYSDHTASWAGAIVGLSGCVNTINCLSYGHLDTDEHGDYHCGHMTGCSANFMNHVVFHNSPCDWAAGMNKDTNLGDHMIIDYMDVGSELTQDVINYLNDWVNNTGKVIINSYSDDSQKDFFAWSSSGLNF